MVLDLSSGGLFVQTGAPPAPGEEIRIRLRDTGDELIELDAVVARRRIVPQHLSGVTAGGIGLRILDPSEAYQRFLARLRGEEFVSDDEQDQTEATPAEPPEPEAPEIDPPRRRGPAKHTFRVRVKQSGRPRSRNVLVTCASERAARSQVIDELGQGWDILEITRL
jgi:hypothetical protein